MPFVNASGTYTGEAILLLIYYKIISSKKAYELTVYVIIMKKGGMCSMLKKAVLILKENPVLILLYLLYTGLFTATFYSIMPKQFDPTDITELMIYTVKMMLISVVGGASSLIFLSGYG